MEEGLLALSAERTELCTEDMGGATTSSFRNQHFGEGPGRFWTGGPGHMAEDMVMVGVTTLEDSTMEGIQTLRVETLEVLQGSGLEVLLT